MKQHKPYHHGDLRRALIKTGLEMIDREGVQALSIRRLAAEIGVSHTAPIYHFANKNELVEAIATEGFRIFNETIAPALKESDPEARFIGHGERYFQFASDHVAYYRLIFGVAAPGGDVLCRANSNDLMREAMRSFEALLSSVTNYLRAKGVEGPDFEKRVRMTALMVWSYVHGTVMLWFDNIWLIKLPGINRVIEEQGYLTAFRPMVDNTLAFLKKYIVEFARGEIQDWEIPQEEEHTPGFDPPRG